MPGSSLPVKVKATDDAHPFGLPWMDSCYQETLLPDGPWIRVATLICEGLVKRIEKQFNYPDRKQMIFELLGLEFMKKYFPKEDFNPLVLEPPLKSREDRKKLQLDAQNWLQSAITSVAKETRNQRPRVAQQEGNELSRDMEGFLAHTNMIFNKGMDRHLLLLEKEIQKEYALEAWEKHEQNEAARESRNRLRERARIQQERTRLYGTPATAGLRSILKNADEIPAERLTTASTVATRPVTANVKGAIFDSSVDPPRFWSMQSDSLARSIVAIMKRDPRRTTEVMARLQGRQLSGQLRQYLWTDALLKHERQQHVDVNVESIVRERFVRGVKAGLTELKTRKATHSPIHGLIVNTVFETFEKTAAMAEYRSDAVFIREASRALNVLYTYDRSYEPYLVHWLFPLQLCYEDNMGDGEHVYELGMYLDLLSKTLFPKWPEIFAAAERVMQRLQREDAELHDHLRRIAQIDANVNPKEFLVDVLQKEVSQAGVLLNQQKQSSTFPAAGAKLLVDPLIFLRKLMGEGFVGVLDTQAALFIWDQLFLQRWHLQVFENTCLALLLLLRHKFMRAHNYSTMKQVFFRQPCLVYTTDLQHAWIHVTQGGELGEVPKMNRLRPEARAATPPRRTSPTQSMVSHSPLEAFVLGRLRMTLIFAAESIQQEQWLSKLAMDRLGLDCHLYFGDIKVKTSSVKAVPRQLDKVKDDQYGGLRYNIEIPEEIRFLDIDVGRFDLEMEMGGYPYAVVELKYTNDQGVSVPLGWARVKLFSQSLDQGAPASTRLPWKLLDRDQYYPLYSGPPLEKFSTARDSPRPTGGRGSPGSVDTLFLDRYADLLADGSQIGIFVYNPSRQPQTVVARTPPPPRPKSRRMDTPKASPKLPPVPVPPPDTKPPPKTATPAPRSPKDLSISDAFDIYVDAVTNLPDNASIIKVTGRLVKTGELTEQPDILSLPDLKSNARSPTFTYQYNVNKGKVKLDPDLLILLRVYTVDIDTKDLVVVGSCFFEVFDQRQLVKLGAHCRRLHCGLPDIKSGVKILHHNSLDKGQLIPGCCIFFRLEKAGTSFKKAPTPSSYKLDDQVFNESEKRVVRSYKADGGTPGTVEAAVRHLQQLEKVAQSEQKKSPVTWLTNRLDQKLQLPPNQPADDIDLNRLVRYRQPVGLSVCVRSAYGLPEGHYYQAYCSVLAGAASAGKKPTAEGSGSSEKCFTLKHDWASLQSKPKWTDEPQRWHPHLDQFSLILIQLFQFDLKYTPTKDNQNLGKVTTANGKNLSVGPADVFAWTVVPLFEKDYVFNGLHHGPLFRGRPAPEILADFKQELPETVIAKKKWVPKLLMEGAAVVLELYDAHYVIDEIPGELERTDFLLDQLPSRDPWAASEAVATGAALETLVRKHLDKKHQKDDSPIYAKERGFFQAAAEAVYKSVIEIATASGKVGVL